MLRIVVSKFKLVIFIYSLYSYYMALVRLKSNFEQMKVQITEIYSFNYNWDVHKGYLKIGYHCDSLKNKIICVNQTKNKGI